MRNAMTISFPPELAKQQDVAVKKNGKSRSRFIQDAVRNQLFREQIESARRIGVPAARRAGWYTDEDIFKAVS